MWPYASEYTVGRRCLQKFRYGIYRYGEQFGWQNIISGYLSSCSRGGRLSTGTLRCTGGRADIQRLELTPQGIPTLRGGNVVGLC